MVANDVFATTVTDPVVPNEKTEDTASSADQANVDGASTESEKVVVEEPEEPEEPPIITSVADNDVVVIAPEVIKEPEPEPEKSE